jgi:replication factor C small subunit
VDSYPATDYLASMEAPLWTETHAPDVDELPQTEVREYLERASEEPINLILHGPSGVGKTAAVKALARETHEDPDNDLTTINVADFFGRSKKEIRNDPRFEPFLEGRSRMSKANMVNYVLKESAAYPPVTGTYKTVLLDNAEAIREDFQQALRRVMEQYARNTQFVICTRQPSKLIPPIRSRCFSVPVRAPTETEIVAVLERIVDREEVDAEPDGLEYVAAYADGDLRRAILGAQTTVAEAGELTTEAAYEVLGGIGYEESVGGMLAAAEAGEFDDARKTLDSLLNDEGLDGGEVLRELLVAGRERHEGDDQAIARLHRVAAETDADLQEGRSARVHLSALLAELGR